MIYRILLGLVYASVLGIALIQFPTVTDAAGTELAVLLPKSDGVIVFDSARIVKEALPQVLSANAPMLEKINGEIEKLKTKSGLDLRQFQNVAVGLKTLESETGSNEFDAVLLARGDLTLGSLEEVANIASKGKFSTVYHGSRTIYVFAPHSLMKKAKINANGESFVEGMFGKMFKGMATQVAITAYDSNTVAFGSLSRVKEAVGNGPRVDAEILGLLDSNPGSLASLGMIVPKGMSQFLELEDDELGANLDSIRQIQGSFDLNDGAAIISIAAKTTESDNAQELTATLQAIRGMVAGILKGNQNADKQVYGRMLENLEVTRIENEIKIDLRVPQSDLDVIVGKK